jgi:hypothetical protein
MAIWEKLIFCHVLPTLIFFHSRVHRGGLRVIELKELLLNGIKKFAPAATMAR